MIRLFAPLDQLAASKMYPYTESIFIFIWKQLLLKQHVQKLFNIHERRLLLKDTISQKPY
jgi:hypothetical protein